MLSSLQTVGNNDCFAKVHFNNINLLNAMDCAEDEPPRYYTL